LKKRKKSDVQWYRWPSGKKKAEVVFVKHFVVPYVEARHRIDDSDFAREQMEAQKRLEEAALLARWRRKHQSISGGSRSAGRPGAACKRSSGKSRRASR
jgi:hypothetical protein